jgi:hypothetical protein
MFVTKIEADKYIAEQKVELMKLQARLKELEDMTSLWFDHLGRKVDEIIEKHNNLVDHLIPDTPRTFDWAYRQAKGIYGR